MAPPILETAPLQQTGLAIVAGLPLLAACFVAVRIYARKRLRLPLDWDDYVIAVASVLSIALIFPSWRMIKMWHFGISIYNLDPDWTKLEPDFNEYHKVLIAFNIINTPILPLVKASILLLLLKVGKLVTPIRRALYCMLVFIFGACLGPWVAMIFMCPPLSGNKTGDRVFGNARCLGKRPAAIVYLFLLSVNILTDLLILPIPNVLLWRVKNISIRARMTVFVVSLLMLGATGIAVARFVEELEHQLYQVDPVDWTYTIRFTLHHAENNVAIMLACMPMIRTLILQWNKRNWSHQSPDSSDTINRRRVQRDSILLHSYDQDGVIDPAPMPLEKKTARFEEAMVRIEEDLKNADGGEEMEFVQVESGRIEMRRKPSAIGLTIPKPTHKKTTSKGESSKSQNYHKDQEDV